MCVLQNGKGIPCLSYKMNASREELRVGEKRHWMNLCTGGQRSHNFNSLESHSKHNKQIVHSKTYHQPTQKMKITPNLFILSPITFAAAHSIRGRQTEESQGRVFHERIIGGEAAPVGLYPYIVSLQGASGHFCGGSLIAPDVVLSAAHCKNW